MTEIIENLQELPGRTLHDQEGKRIGKIEALYAVGEDREPAWVSVKGGLGSGDAFVPVARLKEENGELRVPYSKDHIGNGPEIDADSELSEEAEAELRQYYAIGYADQELRKANDSYAAAVPDEGGPAVRLDGSEPAEADGD